MFRMSLTSYSFFSSKSPSLPLCSLLLIKIFVPHLIFQPVKVHFFFFFLSDKDGVLDMGYKDFGYMYSLYGDLVIFNSDDEAIRLRNILHNVFRPEEVTRYMGDVEVVSSRLLNSIEDNDIVIPYKLFKQLTTEVCLRLFLGLEMETAKKEAESVVELTITHWHGKSLMMEIFLMEQPTK